MGPGAQSANLSATRCPVPSSRWRTLANSKYPPICIDAGGIPIKRLAMPI